MPLSAKSYHAYLRTPQWKQRAASHVAQAGFHCQHNGCFSTRNLQVHHKTYARLGEELFTDLIVLCEKHHKAVHRIDL